MSHENYETKTKQKTLKKKVGLEWTFESFQWWRVTDGVQARGPATAKARSPSVDLQVAWCDWPQTTPWFHTRHCLLKVARCWSVQQLAAVMLTFIMPLPPWGGALCNDGRCLLSVCLSVCPVPEHKSRTEALSKLTIGTSEAHDTSDPWPHL